MWISWRLVALPILAAQLPRGHGLLLFLGGIGSLGLLLGRLFLDGFRGSVTHDGFPLDWGLLTCGRWFSGGKATVSGHRGHCKHPRRTRAAPARSRRAGSGQRSVFFTTVCTDPAAAAGLIGADLFSPEAAESAQGVEVWGQGSGVGGIRTPQSRSCAFWASGGQNSSAASETL